MNSADSFFFSSRILRRKSEKKNGIRYCCRAGPSPEAAFVCARVLAHYPAHVNPSCRLDRIIAGSQKKKRIDSLSSFFSSSIQCHRRHFLPTSLLFSFPY